MTLLDEVIESRKELLGEVLGLIRDAHTGNLHNEYSSFRQKKEVKNKSEYLASIYVLGTEKSGETPEVIAASAVYLAGMLSNKRITQETLADEFGTNTTYIRRTYQKILEEISTYNK